MTEVPEPLLGTTQYPDAGDLSSYLVHLTWTGEALASILTQGRLEARGSFGLAGQNSEHAETHKAVCFTETPANELHRFGGRRFGLVFKRDFIIQHGGQRVWYIDHGTPLWDAFRHELNRLRAITEDHRFFEMTPFIDMVRPGTYAFDWEREWRVVGDLRFDWSDVEYIVTPEQGLLTFEKPEVGKAFWNPHNAEYIWTGGTLTELDDAMSALVTEFYENFTSPENELAYDSESEDGYAWGHFTAWRTEEAVDHIFDDRPYEVRQALSDLLNETSLDWLHRDEVNEPPDDD